MKTVITFLAVMASIVSCSQSNAVVDTLWPPPPFGEGDSVTLKQGVEKVRTFHCSRCSEQEVFPCEFRYDLFGGETVQVRSHDKLGYWLDQTAFFPRCSYCRIHHASKGAAWVDCGFLTRVEMQEGK